MLLYKFRSLYGEGLTHALDMVINERVYLSTVDKMNDPHEGGFDITKLFLQMKDGEERDLYLENSHKVRSLIDQTRFTCFTESAEDPLLWAHYAGGYSGVAFQYELPESITGFDLLPVSYAGIIPKLTPFNCSDIVNKNKKLYELGVLLTKKKEWAYEREFRLFSINGAAYLEKIKPKGIIFAGRKSAQSDIFMDICKKLELRIGYLTPSASPEHNYYLLFPDDPPTDDSEHIEGRWVNEE